MIHRGDTFPPFSLQDQDGNTVTSDDLKGSKSVIYFYPKDDTPGCTVEACELRDAMPSFAGVRILGVSPDPPKSHRKFVDKFSLNFTLLADVDHELAEACGVWVEKSMYGKTYMGVGRSTFVLDENLMVSAVFEKVTPRGHAQEIQDALS